MDRFLVRITEAQAAADAGGVDMQTGSQAVHDAIQNEGRASQEQEVTKPSKDPHREKLNKGEAICCSCAQIKPSGAGFFTGRAKATFRCYDCNKLELKLQRLTKGTHAAELWRDLPQEEKEAFRAERAELETAALKDALTVKLVQRQLKIDSQSKGFLGEFLPLSVYKTRGYDPKYIKWIEENCDKRKEAGVWIYALRIHHVASKEEIQVITESIWRPKEQDQRKRRKRKSSSSSSQSCSSSSCSSPKKTSKKAKRAAIKEKTKAKRALKAREQDLKLANKVVAQIAPTLGKLKIAKQRLTPSIRQLMPEYQVRDAEQWLQKLSELDDNWSQVAKGHACTSGLDANKVGQVVASAKAATNLLNSSIQMAENIEKSKQDNTADTDEKTKKKKKTRK